MQLIPIDNLPDIQAQLVQIARAGQRAALVPTMGALHEGHLALIKAAKAVVDEVIVSIFVNPAQFGPGEDFDQYPRTLEADFELIEKAGARFAYTPSVADVYPPGFVTGVTMGEMGKILCGKSRPGHFDGVATVVTKLLLRILPHVAFFGEKDYQQLCIIRQLVRDLDMPIHIDSVPTVREADGLALSSRNRYLTAAERALAPKLHQTLKDTAAKIRAGGDAKSLPMVAAAALMGMGFKVDYVELREEETLYEPGDKGLPCRLLAAATLGKTRLIDNVVV